MERLTRLLTNKVSSLIHYDISLFFKTKIQLSGNFQILVLRYS